MKSIKLNSTAARKRGEAGLSQAIEAADRHHPDWAEKAYAFFKKWLSRKPSGYRFQVESFRLSVQISGGLKQPKNARAFGGIVVRARNEKLIKSCGPKPTSSVTAHGCYSNEWKKI